MHARKPELLAPAGNMAAFQAALLAGADAIYLGLGDFNARRNAGNFTLETLRQACRLAHLAGRRVYLTANILILERELDAAVDLVVAAWQQGVDAIIVTDLGLITRLHEEYPHIELHMSTQMSLCNEAGIELARELGASRVTLARELSLDEVSSLAALGMDLEVFAHGALCICYSGQCLMSSLIGRRSANRGLCAQPCRLPWELTDAQGHSIEAPGEHLLSPRDLCTIDMLPQLIDAGIASLKIEGRMKSPEYVSTVVGTYRACLDRAYDDPTHYAATLAEKNALAEAFSRGFTQGYLAGERGNELMSYTRPNNRGVLIGRVAGLHDGIVEVTTEKPLSTGDTLEFWTSRGNHTLVVPMLLVDGREVARAEAGQRVGLRVPHPVAPGDRVFRVRNAQLAAEVAAGANEFAGVPCELTVTLEARIGEPLYCLVRDAQERAGAAHGATVEPARTRAVSIEDMKEHFARLGGTPYRVAQWNITLDDGVGLPFSQLHALRREAIAAYEDELLQAWEKNRGTRTSEEAAECENTPDGIAQSTKKRGTDEQREGTATSSARGLATLEVAVIAREASLARACLERGANMAYALVQDTTGRWGDEGAWPAGSVPLLPTIAHDRELAGLYALAGAEKPVVCDSLALLVRLARAPFHAQVEAGPRMGSLNPVSLQALERFGAARVWLSPELSLVQIESLSKSTTLPFSITVSGREQLMITEHCELMSQGPCARQCATCSRRAEVHLLHDRKGYDFPVLTDLAGRGRIYNSVELDVIDAIPQLAASGVTRFIVDATLLDEAEACARVQRIARVVADLNAGRTPNLPSRRDESTTGHLFRGVL